MDPQDKRLLDAVRFAQEAGNGTLKFFRDSHLDIERKGDGSPVTEADRGAEELLRQRILESYPDDAILGEELGDHVGSSGYRWILDPIDGTKSFIHGAPLYTTLVAVLQESPGGQAAEPLLGVIYAPATGETVYAQVGGGCWLQQGEESPVRTVVSGIGQICDGLLLTTDVASFGKDRQADAYDVYQTLEKQSRLARTWGDAYGYLMVATGRAEVMLDPALSLWDAAALKPVIEEAGGRFSDWQGNPTVHTGDAVATNGLVHEAVLAHTRGR